MGDWEEGRNKDKRRDCIQQVGTEAVETETSPGDACVCEESHLTEQ
jgi:hypothetical protein